MAISIPSPGPSVRPPRKKLFAYMHMYAYSARMNYDQAKVRADILKALAHPIRIILVDALRQRERCVCELNELVDLDQSTVSRHLAQLKRAGIVGERRQGTKIIHHLDCPCMLQAIDCTVEVLEKKSRRHRDAMKTEAVCLVN